MDGKASGADAAKLAEAVRAFYERHPYPPPVDDLDSYRKRWDDRQRRRADSHFFWPDEPYREDRSVLVAGCGTGQQPIATAQRVSQLNASVAELELRLKEIEARRGYRS